MLPNSLTAAEILQALPYLPPSDLDQISSKIQLLKSTGEPFKSVAPSGDEELLLMAISDLFTGRGLEYCYAAMLKRAPGYHAFKDKTFAIIKYINNGMGNREQPLNKAELLSFFRESVRLLYDDMQQIGLTVSSRTLMNHVHRIPAVLNKSYPGYAERHLLWLVVRRPR